MLQVIEVIATGIVMGCVHVLTGPDHLSALATLSNNVPVCHAFRLGVSLCVTVLPSFLSSAVADQYLLRFCLSNSVLDTMGCRT